MVGIIYFIIVVLSNTIGSVSGMGGGVIIKPLFDLIRYNSVATISFYTSSAVLTMAIVSTTRQARSGLSINWLFSFQISLGAIIGGLLGNYVFDQILKFFPDGKAVQLIQISITIVTLITSYLYTRGIWKNFHFKSVILKIGVGILLGFLASLLGIGGGPINVALLMLLFNVSIKEATVYSIVNIFFSQLSKIIVTLWTAHIELHDLHMLYYIIPAAFIGGFVGSMISDRISAKKVDRIYQAMVVLVLIINIYNACRLF